MSHLLPHRRRSFVCQLLASSRGRAAAGGMAVLLWAGLAASRAPAQDAQSSVGAPLGVAASPVVSPGADPEPNFPFGAHEGGDPAFAEAIGKGPRDPFKNARAQRDAEGGPLGWAGRVPYVPGDVNQPDSAFTINDRWRGAFPTWDRFVRGVPLDSYHQNVLKGDYPICGTCDLFFSFTGVSDTFFEWRELPVKEGAQHQHVYNSNLFTTFDVFKGDNSFHPSEWFLRVTPVFNLRDQTNVGTRGDFTIQEGFADVLLSARFPFYDTTDLRIGRQGINADFRGFLFADVNDAVRLFGNADENRYQYQVFATNMVLKDNVSQLNTFRSRHQQIVGATLVRQDFIFQGLNALVGLTYDHDELVEEVNAGYAEFALDGHIGRLNVSAAFIQSFGKDNMNPIANRAVTLDGQLAALELAIPFDWFVPKVSALYLSGENDPTSGKGRGFDAIFDNPQFAGGGFSFYDRENLNPGALKNLNKAAANFTNAFSLMADLRTRFVQPVNAVNPGLILLNTGFSAALTTRINFQANFNYYNVMESQPIEVLVKKHVGKEIGGEINAGLQYAPLIIPNVIFTAGASALAPGAAFKDLNKSSETLFNTFVAVTLVY